MLDAGVLDGRVLGVGVLGLCAHVDLLLLLGRQGGAGLGGGRQKVGARHLTAPHDTLDGEGELPSLRDGREDREGWWRGL